MNRKPEDPRPGGRELLGAEDADDTGLKRPENKRDLRLPHERDEAPDLLDSSETTPVSGPRQVIEQAASDLSRGLVDTDRHGTPSDVPAPGPTPEESPGAEVPDEGGLDRLSLSGRGEKKIPRPGKDAPHT